MSAEPCPYFDTYIATVQPLGRSQPIPLCIALCRLAQEMKQRLETTDEAKPLTDALTVAPHNAPPRFFCGADLEPPAEPSCTTHRLQQRCIPSFQTLMTTFQLDSQLPYEETPSNS